MRYKQYDLHLSLSVPKHTETTPYYTLCKDLVSLDRNDLIIGLGIKDAESGHWRTTPGVLISELHPLFCFGMLEKTDALWQYLNKNAALTTRYEKIDGEVSEWLVGERLKFIKQKEHEYNKEGDVRSRD